MGWTQTSGFENAHPSVKAALQPTTEPYMSRSRLRSAISRYRANLRTRARHAALAVNPAAFSGRTNSPADFDAWVERGAGRTGGFPDAWRQLDLGITSRARVAVVFHVHYRELVEEVIEQLRTIPVEFDLIVTNSSVEPLDLATATLPRASHVVVLDIENHGRDILPLISLVNAGLLTPYQLILKVHTKLSPWRADHDELPGTGGAWRERLLSDLLGSETNVRSILNGFATRPDLGLVTADGSRLGPEFWGDNQAVTAALLRRVELELREDDLSFAAGSMYWVRGFILQGLRALNLTREDFEPEAGQVNATTAHAIERLLGILSKEAGLSVATRAELPTPTVAENDWKRFESGRPLRPRARLVPFYLPQFHPIEQNDRWWGPGFTEWSNVAAARPVFHGHHQPKLPTETGFYDLRLEESVRLQAGLAKMAGIEGFMYYHYWFAGTELLGDPIRSRLAGDIDLPFCVMWANENWTRRWDGRESDVLMGQRYDEVSAVGFLDDIVAILRDRRYMKIDGRPVIAVYRPAQIPDVAAVIAAWREKGRQGGIGELFVLNVDVVKEFHGIEGDLTASGLDGSLGFPPHNALWDWLPQGRVGVPAGFGGNILSYRSLVEDAIRKLQAGLPETYFPGVMVNFDNTARRQGTPDIWFGSNPYTFRRWLAAAVAAIAHREFDRRIVFINAWNEWAEGAVLEPSDRFGSTFLLAVRDVAFG
jgi:lipopolysaccharide biosynthesis protein